MEAKIIFLLSTLFLLGPAIMQYILEENKFNHLCSLFHGMRLLFMNKIPTDEIIDESQRYINQFLMDWPTYYPNSALSFVVHSIEHLPEACRKQGGTPDTFSAFPFESFLRRVKDYYHSGGKHLQQVSNILKYNFSRFLKSVKKSLYEKNLL